MYTLFASVPYTALWSRSLLVEGREPHAALFAAAHALGVWTIVLASDRADADEDEGSRSVALWRFPLGESEGASSAAAVAFPVLALLTIGALTGLIASSPWLGACAAALFVIGLLHATRPRVRKLILVELLAPAGVLLAPMALVGAFAATPLPQAAVGATLLGAVLLGLALLLCAMRDAPSDALRGRRTTPTRLGRRTAGMLAVAWVACAVTLSIFGASWGWWGWPVPLAVALGAFATGGALARGAYERLVAVWTLVFWITSAAFFVQALTHQM